VLAREVVEERPELVIHDLWIIDEFQDFNHAEDHLIRCLTAQAAGVMIAGDDEQALYQQLKASLPEIIVSYYEGTEFGNAMLPYCSRCSYHVCLAASQFIAGGRTSGGIDKVYLPLAVNPEATKVQVVATNTPASALDYIKKFVEDHQEELDAHIAGR
jgi:superfamily I DNA/RNA helicase